MENNNVKQQNTGSGSNAGNANSNIGTAGSEGTQAFNNGNEGKTGNDRGQTESGAFDTENAGGYEGGKLGTAGSGGMDIPATESGVEGAGKINEGSGSANTSAGDKVPVPIVKDNYKGGNMGTAGSGSMEVHGSESSLSVNALADDKDSGESNQQNGGSRNPHGLGSPPAPDIADGGDGGAKQPKEHTGQGTEMGGATGGNSGMGNGNSNSGLEGEGVGNKEGSQSGSGGGGSSAGS